MLSKNDLGSVGGKLPSAGAVTYEEKARKWGAVEEAFEEEAAD